MRVREGLDDLVASMAPGECVVVSTHGAAARAVAAALLDLDLALAWRDPRQLRPNCHWAELERGNHGWRLVTWNVSAGLVETVEGRRHLSSGGCRADLAGRRCVA